ncbi:ParB/RepB/Spo0J family partition protein [Sphingopyxis macrogoltabida]|uniref:Chromosome partitioning protein ParB n=1 Tax=Sphingopyxis macrogoltabida TaxID=33050 RepID=A0AAC9AZC4_SPHMC|nr:ParB/RepB/Spo0J family partition protein [Sphingopyxis macrogoltabida]ALJ16261.1 chromosome partitioning protein ParB [Sphingopyxis macrogoltabida]AMU92499.1 chromosome partitioning protein ParB [Sphingopyxis macrogoltabida]
MAKGNRGFGSSLTEGLEEAEALDDVAPAEGIMASRSQTLARIASGKMVTDRTEWVDPARCRPWRLHNRDIDHLTEESCRDLIDAFLSAKKQRIPAIVRRLKDDPNHDFEIIAGVRRWWTVQWLRDHHHPEYEYLVTIQKVDDEEAFRVSDIENRSRKDITDWERGVEYSRALTEFYNGSQNEMAEHLNISRSWLSRLLDVVRLPEAIIAAFSDRHDITVRVARDIKPLTGEQRALETMTKEAAKIIAERDDLGVRLSGPEVAKRLVKSTLSQKASADSEIEVQGKGGKAILRYTRTARGGLTLKVLPKTGASNEELLSVIEGILEAR